MNGLDLFSGIGGLSLALAPWVRPIAYCENDRYAQSVLLSRMRRRELTTAPIWDDVTTLVPELLPRDEVDCIYGGFPCQDISTAGNGAGLEGKRSGLFFEIIRLVSALRPRFVFLENVPAITVRGLDRVLLEFTALGYDCRWTIVSAEEVGACHKRERWFLLANTSSERCVEARTVRFNQPKKRTSCGCESLTDPNCVSLWAEQGKESRATAVSGSLGEEGYASDSSGKRRQREDGQEGFGEKKLPKPARFDEWKSEPTIRGRDHGISNRLDRLRGLGNAVVPLQAREAFARLSGVFETTTDPKDAKKFVLGLPVQSGKSFNQPLICTKGVK